MYNSAPPAREVPNILMPRHVDALTSPTLKHLRERWWDSDFSEFLRETLRPRPGTRILDVGCGEGTAELSLGRLQISQVSIFAIDRKVERVRQTLTAATAHNIRVQVAAADAQALPFAGDTFDSTFCVAVLQHSPDVARVVSEFARVTKPGGRVVVVEPDNAARYWYSSSPAGRHAYEVGTRLFAAAAQARRDATDPSVGPKLPAIFGAAGLEPLWVNLFPVSVTRMGPPPAAVWQGRRHALQAMGEAAPDASVRSLVAEYSAALDAYEKEAAAAGPGFVEIQNTMLFATVGQKPE
jgi:SAM-dependent methyltransferase